MNDPYYPGYQRRLGYQPKHRAEEPKHRGVPVSEAREAELLTPHPKHRREDTDA